MGPLERLIRSLCIYLLFVVPPRLGAKTLSDTALACWLHLGPSCFILNHPGSFLDHLGSILGHLGTILGHLASILAPSWLPLGPSRLHLGSVLHERDPRFNTFSRSEIHLGSIFRNLEYLASIWAHQLAPSATIFHERGPFL